MLEHPAFRKLTLFLWILVLFSCGDKEPVPRGESTPLALVGDEVISVGEFRHNYETGFSHLKTGDDPKRTYLELMIREKLLSSEGYRLGLDKNESVQQSREQLLNELMVEELIVQEVKSKIRVSEQEIKEAINQSKVSFKFRYWPAPDLARAAEISSDMKERGYAAVVDDLLRENPESPINPSDLESAYVSASAIEPALLAGIKDLPIGDISDPVNIGGKFYVCQVLDIRRSAVTTNEYIQKASTFEQVVFHNKYQQQVTGYVSSLLTPRNIVTRGSSFTALANAIVAWRRMNRREKTSTAFKDALEKSTADQPALYRLKVAGNEPFVTFEGGQISISEFMGMFEMSRLEVANKNADKEFVEVLDETVAMTIRDHFLLQEARKQELQTSARVQKELKDWTDKWVYEAARNHFTAGIGISEDEAKAYFETYQQKYKTQKDQQLNYADDAGRYRREAYLNKRFSALGKTASGLQSRYPVRIYEEVLDTIRVVEFEKSKWASLQIYKVGANRPAYPFVDPSWGSIPPPK